MVFCCLFFFRSHIGNRCALKQWVLSIVVILLCTLSLYHLFLLLMFVPIKWYFCHSFYCNRERTKYARGKWDHFASFNWTRKKLFLKLRRWEQNTLRYGETHCRTKDVFFSYSQWQQKYIFFCTLWQSLQWFGDEKISSRKIYCIFF